MLRFENDAMWAPPEELLIARPLLAQSAVKPRVFYHEGRREPRNTEEKNDLEWVSGNVLKIEDDMAIRCYGQIDFMYLRVFH